MLIRVPTKDKWINAVIDDDAMIDEDKAQVLERPIQLTIE